MSELSLPDKIVAIDRSLQAASIPHAFGGALALAYYAEPRATDDVDINVFVAPKAFMDVAKPLGTLGVSTDVEPLALEREGQCRLWWGRTPLDLFFAYDEIHDAMHRDTRLVPFGDARLPILSPEHLLVCKVAFDRPKDWLDAEQMLVVTEDLDSDEIQAWLERMLGAEDPRARRFAGMVKTLLSA
jgi:hypothetical protein